MKTATILDKNERIFALEIDGHWFDFGKILYAYSRKTPDMPIADDMSMEEWVKHGLLWAENISTIVTSLLDSHSLSEFSISTPTDFQLPFKPGNIICLGRNYAAHAKEQGSDIPEYPMLFNKLPSTCIGDEDAIEIDSQWGRVDYEGELALVIGKTARHVGVKEGSEYVCGYTLLNDITARDFQFHVKDIGHPWFMAKNRDTFCPIGPAVTLTDSITDPIELTITLKLNGEVKQLGNTDAFIFSIGEMISWISQHITLEPGDIIATGTPEGVGALSPGDKIELDIPEIGILRNHVVNKVPK